MIRLARRYVRRHGQVLRSTLAQLGRAPLASAMTVAVIGITLALPAGLYLLIANLERVSQGWDTGGQISLFLRHETSDTSAAELARRVGDMRAVERVEYVPRDEALAEFKRLSGFGDALVVLDENPLPAVLTVHPIPAAAPDTIEALVRELAALEAVESAQLDLEWVRRLHVLLAIARRAALVLAGLLGLAALLTVGNTIRLAIMNRRDEIEVMKLMGGTNAFIRRPFLYAGLVHGLLGAVAAWLILALVWLSLREPIAELAALYGSNLDLAGLGLRGSGLLLAVGGLLGWLGSRLSVGRHLRAIEPS